MVRIASLFLGGLCLTLQLLALIGIFAIGLCLLPAFFLQDVRRKKLA